MEYITEESLKMDQPQKKQKSRFELQVDNHEIELWKEKAKEKNISLAQLIRNSVFHYLKKEDQL